MSTVLVIDGITITRVNYAMRLYGGDLFGRGVVPNIRFSIQGGKLADFPSWDFKTVTLSEGGTLIFAGDTGRHLDHYDEHQIGWVREWTALGLVNRSYRIPVTDSNSLTDTINYNMSPEDGPLFIPSRAGRTVGQIVADVLEMDDNAIALSAHGIGQYTSAGTGAAGVANMLTGGVDTVTMTAGGSGYTTAPSVLFCGGSPSVRATGHCTVSLGVVTVVVDTSGSGYLAAPVVLISRLPTATLTDLDTLGVIPPQRVTLSGERILQVIESTVQVYHPNHWLHVDPDGTIRFYDPRAYTNDIVLTLDGSDPRVPKPSLLREWNECYQRVVIRGNTKVQGQLFGLLPWAGSSAMDGGLQEDFAHDGLSNADAKAAWTSADWNQPGQSSGQATATCSLSGSGISTSFTITNGGYNYGSAPTILFSGGGGAGAAATASLTSGVVTSITRTSAGSGYTTAPTMLLTAPGVGQSILGTCTMGSTTSVTCTPTDPTIQFPADWGDQTSTGHLWNIVLYSDVISGITQRWPARVIANTSLSPGGTFDVTIDDPAPATTYTSFQIFGTGGGAGVVYRKYKLSDSTIAARVQQVFPYPYPFRSGTSLEEILVTDAQATVFKMASGGAYAQQLAVGIASIDPDGNAFVLSKPSALVFSANGTTAVPADDVQLFLPVAVGILEAIYPPDSGGPVYAGTSNTIEGMTETKFVTVREWKDYSNAANMLLWASEMLDALKDTVIEGDVLYNGLLTSVLTPGHKMNLPGDGYTSGWESIDIPIARVSLAYNEEGAGTSYTTTLSVSNRRAPYSGEAFARPSQVGLPVGLSEGDFSFAPTAEGMAALDQGAANQDQAKANAQPISTGNATVLAPTDLSGIPTTPGEFMQSQGLATTPGEFLKNQGLPTGEEE